jgi:hypothetical protein
MGLSLKMAFEASGEFVFSSCGKAFARCALLFSPGKTVFAHC